MPKIKISDIEIKEIIEARKNGKSLSELAREFSRSKATISKYIQGIEFNELAQITWERKRFPSKFKSESEWLNAQEKAKKLIEKISERDNIFILIGLYWGEGNKKDLNLINSDPMMIKKFISLLKEIGVKKEFIKVSIRIFDDIDIENALNFWEKVTSISKNEFSKIEIIKGKKKGKLQWGMCRVRVVKSGLYLKLILSMIDLVRKS